MKTSYYLLCSLLLLCSPLFGQLVPASETISVNNVQALVRSNGSLFWDVDGQKGQFLTNDSGFSTMRAAGLWISGLDPAQNLSGAIQLYNEDGREDFVPLKDMNKIWKVRRQQILDHQADFADNGIIDNPIPSIFAWPGNGNPQFDQYNESGILLSSNSTAPFYDLQGDNVYNPSQGDFPIYNLANCDMEDPDQSVLPDEMLWFVYNDDGLNTASSLDPLRQEISCMVFAFDCPEKSPLNNSIFVNYTITSRRIEPLTNLYFGVFADFDIGHPDDDFIGSDPDRNLLFAYNGDEEDEGFYGSNAPAMSVCILDGPYNDLREQVGLKHAYPIDLLSITEPHQFYNLLTGKFADGTDVPDGGILYPGNPNNLNPDSELGAGNLPGERKGLLSVGPLNAFDPGAVTQFTVGYTFHQEEGQSAIENVESMYGDVDDIQSFFDNCFEGGLNCNRLSTSVQTLPDLQMQLYPNPTSNLLHIQLSDNSLSDLRMTDLKGEVVLQKSLSSPQAHYELSLNALANGFYLLEGRLTDGQQFVEKIIIVR
ncbi:MAG: T9SS type A sorting domain-containing protein [Bacteroidota bacterium]